MMDAIVRESPIEVIRRRAASLRVGDFNDDCHLALVIEGGGMRGVVAGGMVTALQESALLPIFNSIHGSSAGACAGAYFTAGQAGLGTSIYYEDINNKKFIDLMRFFRGRAVMDTSFLIDHVMRNIKILDVQKILDRPRFLHIIATNADTGEAECFNTFRDVDHFFTVLKASITMPIIGGRWVQIDGRRFVDGGMTQQIPIRSAVESGATHIVALLTRKVGELERQQSPWSRLLEGTLLRSVYGKPLTDVYMQRAADINGVIRQLMNPGTDCVRPSCSAIVRPSDSVDVSRLSTDADAMRAADQIARDTVHRSIGL